MTNSRGGSRSNPLALDECAWIKKVYRSSDRQLFHAVKDLHKNEWKTHSNVGRARVAMQKYTVLGMSPPPGPFYLEGHTLSADSEDNPVEAGIDDAVLAVASPTHAESAPSPGTGSSSATTSPTLQISDSAVRGPTRPYAACSSFPCCDPTACTAPTCLQIVRRTPRL